MPHLRFIPFLIIHGILAAFVLVLFANVQIARASAGRVYHAADSIPENSVGLLLGTSPYLVSGRLNPFFEHRIRAAVELLRAGRIEYILASGDNEHRSYNEPVQMKKALLAAGVPDTAIVLDFAGFRTLDSVVRASEVFGQQRLTVISQEFHTRRALYIANRYTIDAVAFVADDVGGYTGVRMQLREQLARTLAVLDVQVLGTRPRFLGEPVPVPVP
ncbi:MAG: SanA/YdcF family protein [Spirochaetota bacterium]